MCRLYANTTSFYIGDLRIHWFGYLGVPGTNPPWISRDCSQVFCGVKSYIQIFNCARVSASNPPPGCKGQLYILSNTPVLYSSILLLGKPINHQHRSFQVRAPVVFLDLLPIMVHLSNPLQLRKWPELYHLHWYLGTYFHIHTQIKNKQTKASPTLNFRGRTPAKVSVMSAPLSLVHSFIVSQRRPSSVPSQGNIHLEDSWVLYNTST